MRQLRDVEVKRLGRAWRRATDDRLALVLDGVTSPFNVGSIVRTAAAMGVERLWLAGASATPRHPGARKVSMGTERLLTWEAGGNVLDAIAAARADGYAVVGVELADGARPLHLAPLDGDVCLVLGNEDHGLSSAALAACDAGAYLPQPGKVGSLNVAVAAAVAMAECRRRGWAELDGGLPGADEDGA